MMERNVISGSLMKTRPLLSNPERKYKYLCENGSAIMLMIAADGKVIDANNGFLEMSGYSSHDIIGKNVLDFVVAEQRKKTAAEIQAALSNGGTAQFEVAFRSKDGSTRTILLPQKQLVSEEEGQRAILVTGVDITERKHAEEAMSDLAAIVESSDDAIVGKTLDGVITSWNRGAEKLYGYSAEEAKGKPISILIPPNRPDELAKILESLKRGESVQHYDTRRMRKDGTIIEVSLAVSPIRDSTGGVVGASTIARNITERKRMLKALEESEERYRAMVENSPSLIGIFQDGVLKYVNRALIRQLGWTYEELVSPSFNPIENLVSQKSRSLLKENVDKRLRGEEVVHFAISLTRKDGSEVPVLVRGVKILHHQKPAIEFVFDDITERKRAEEALQASEGRLRRITENMLDMVTQTDIEGTCEYASPSFKTVLGYDPKSLLGRSLFELVHPDDLDSTLEIVLKAIATRSTATFDYRYKHADGHYVWLQSVGNPLYDETGQISGTVLTTRDITDRKHLEENLRQHSEHLEELVEAKTADLTASARRYQLLVDNMADAVFTIDLKGNITFLSAQTGKMTGYSAQQLLSMNIKELIAPEDLPEVLRRLEARNRAVLQFELVRMDGTRLPIEVRTSLLFEGTKPVGVQGVARDVSDRKRMEDALRNSETRFRELANLLPQIVFEIDPRGNYTFVNRSGIASAGYTEEEVLSGLNALQTFTEQDRTRIKEDIGRVLAGEKVGANEYTALRKDGTTFPVMVDSRPIIHEGKPVGLRGVAMDITERKRLEERLAEANRFAGIGETAAMVGHDLRNPLQGIAGALHLLKQESLTTEERKEMLQIIEKSVNYSDAIIKDLVDYSAEIKLELAEATPKSITRNAIEAFKVPQNVTVQDLSEDQPTLRVDLDRMRRVFINLIENAIDAMPQGGTLTISSKKTDGKVEIALTDTGSGISEKVMENLWKPLQTTKAKGMGLGLAICKRVVDAHGGSISVKSEVGKGTTLTMQLPLRPVEVNEK